MNDVFLEISAGGATAIAAMACLRVSRTGGARAAWHAAAMVLAAAWAASVVFFLRSPTSAAWSSTCLALLALALGIWAPLVSAMATDAGARSAGAPRLLAWTGLAALPAALVLWLWGTDWLTGIGSEPVLVLTRIGIAALAIAGVPALAAAVVLCRQIASQWARSPWLLLGLAGAATSELLLWVAVLRLGYAGAGQLAASVPLAAAAMFVWLVGLTREVVAVPRLALSRRFVYRSVAASLLLAYVVAAGLVVKVRLLGSAVAGVGLPLALFAGVALFLLAWARWRHPLRLALNRSLFGGKYDYGEVWIHLASVVSRARGLPDLVLQTADYCRELLAVAEFSVWVSGPSGDYRRVALSTDGEPLPSRGEGLVRLPPDAPPSDEERLALRLGVSFASPILVGKRVMGLLAVGSELRPASLDEEDRALLRHVSAQLAGAIGIYRLGDDLADAREMASFHRLSGFVVHDLKNLAVQQSLVLENAKRHGHDARFIQDALAAFEDSTRRMRALIGRLRTPPAELAVSAAPSCDVAVVLEELLSTGGFSNVPDCSLRALLPEDGQPCLAAIEPAALLQVLSHLAVNAVESLEEIGGVVDIVVRRLAGDVCRIEVTDDGCGVAEEYLEQAFRPFRTTKKGGLGMGLYQCKTIVEAAGGTISIAPVAGRGTTVCITLKPGRASTVISEVA